MRGSKLDSLHDAGNAKFHSQQTCEGMVIVRRSDGTRSQKPAPTPRQVHYVVLYLSPGKYHRIHSPCEASSEFRVKERGLSFKRWFIVHGLQLTSSLLIRPYSKPAGDLRKPKIDESKGACFHMLPSSYKQDSEHTVLK